MTDAPEKVEVITSVQRRRRWSAAEKMRMPACGDEAIREAEAANRLRKIPLFGGGLI